MKKSQMINYISPKFKQITYACFVFFTVSCSNINERYKVEEHKKSNQHSSRINKNGSQINHTEKNSVETIDTEEYYSRLVMESHYRFKDHMIRSEHSIFNILNNEKNLSGSSFIYDALNFTPQNGYSLSYYAEAMKLHCDLYNNLLISEDSFLIFLRNAKDSYSFRSIYDAVNFIDNNHNLTLLHYAAIFSYNKVIECLYQAGAKVGCVDSNGKTPSMHASKMETKDLLIKMEKMEKAKKWVSDIRHLCTGPSKNR